MIEKLPPWETIVRQREKIRRRTTTQSPKSNNIYEKSTRPRVKGDAKKTGLTFIHIA